MIDLYNLLIAFAFGLLFGYLFARICQEDKDDYEEDPERELNYRGSERKCNFSHPCTCCESTRVYVFSRDDDNLPCNRYYKTGSCPYKNCKFQHEAHGLCGLFDRLRAARRSVDICMFRLELDYVVDKLIELKGKGLEIRVVSDLNADDRSTKKEEDEKNFINLHKLHNAGIKVRVFKKKGDQRGLMHNKFMIVDNSVVIHGSANLTWSASHHNDELLVISRQTILVANLRKIFKYLFDKYDPLHETLPHTTINIEN